MHIEFLACGTGSARDVAAHLRGARDSTGKPREGVEVLRGDPHRVARRWRTRWGSSTGAPPV